jgi:hypothetical protein
VLILVLLIDNDIVSNNLGSIDIVGDNFIFIDPPQQETCACGAGKDSGM